MRSTMRVLVILSALISCMLADPCVHNNHADLTEEHVINMVVAAADHDDDGVITDLDVLGYFIANFDHNGDRKVDEAEFVKQWHTFFHDEEAFAQHVFHHIDTDDNGLLDVMDINPLILRADTSGDGLVQIDEFKAYLELIYNAC